VPAQLQVAQRDLGDLIPGCCVEPAAETNMAGLRAVDGFVDTRRKSAVSANILARTLQ
jgi:hypothetical protein